MNHNYESIHEYILKGRSKIDRKIANNTTARIEKDKIIIKYHSSDIAELTESTVKLYSDGYKTYTTKERLNWYSPKPFSIFQNKGIWYVWNYENKSEYLFEDGITFIKSDGKWELNQNTCGSLLAANRIKSLRKKINEYSNQYVKKLVDGKLPSPGAGDCWYCSFQTDENESMGESFENTNHFESHFDEKYYVPSLLMNAIRFSPVSSFSNSMIYELWFNPNPENRDLGWGLEIFKTQAKSSIRKFLLRQFKIG